MLMVDLETFWANMLGGDPEVIRTAWKNLNGEERAAVRAHLESMATEEEWSEPQRSAALAALAALRDWPNGTENA
jgi:hypothetical protein